MHNTYQLKRILIYFLRIHYLHKISNNRLRRGDPFLFQLWWTKRPLFFIPRQMAENGFTELGTTFDAKPEKSGEQGGETVDTGLFAWQFLICSTCRECRDPYRRKWNYLLGWNWLISIDVDGLCMNCGEQGHNKLMMTRIPNFREIIIIAFECIRLLCSFMRPSLRF